MYLSLKSLNEVLGITMEVTDRIRLQHNAPS